MYQVPRRAEPRSVVRAVALIVAGNGATVESLVERGLSVDPKVCRRPGRVGHARSVGPGSSFEAMGTETALAEYLPVLYRVALDAVDELARRGRRTEAARLRTSAGRAYSRAWDDSCRRALESIILRAHAAAGTEPPELPLPGLTSSSS